MRFLLLVRGKSDGERETEKKADRCMFRHVFTSGCMQFQAFCTASDSSGLTSPIGLTIRLDLQLGYC